MGNPRAKMSLCMVQCSNRHISTTKCWAPLPEGGKHDQLGKLGYRKYSIPHGQSSLFSWVPGAGQNYYTGGTRTTREPRKSKSEAGKRSVGHPYTCGIPIFRPSDQFMEKSRRNRLRGPSTDLFPSSPLIWGCAPELAGQRSGRGMGMVKSLRCSAAQDWTAIPSHETFCPHLSF